MTKYKTLPVGSYSRRFKCPNCGNSKPNLIEENGEKVTSADLTLLCVAKVEPKDWSFGSDTKPEPDQIDANGKTACGMQWCPNQEEHGS